MQKQTATNRLRQLREGHGLKLYDVAALVRVDPSTIHRWETEQTQVPDEVKKALAERYGVTRAYLMGWETDEATLDQSAAV